LERIINEGETLYKHKTQLLGVVGLHKILIVSNNDYQNTEKKARKASILGETCKATQAHRRSRFSGAVIIKA